MRMLYCMLVFLTMTNDRAEHVTVSILASDSSMAGCSTSVVVTKLRSLSS